MTQNQSRWIVIALKRGREIILCHISSPADFLQELASENIMYQASEQGG